MREAFADQDPPRFHLRDRDSTYRQFFRQRVRSMGLEDVLIAPRSLWQNAHLERFMRSLTEERLGRMIYVGSRRYRGRARSFLRTITGRETISV